MNIHLKNIVLTSKLFEEDDQAPGLYFSYKLNHDVTSEIEKLTQLISDEYCQSIKNWRDAEHESDDNIEYIKGYQDACNDILAEIRERFK